MRHYIFERIVYLLEKVDGKRPKNRVLQASGIDKKTFYILFPKLVTHGFIIENGYGSPIACTEKGANWLRLAQELLEEVKLDSVDGKRTGDN